MHYSLPPLALTVAYRPACFARVSNGLAYSSAVRRLMLAGEPAGRARLIAYRIASPIYVAIRAIDAGNAERVSSALNVDDVSVF